ncbi:MAG TPA: GSU2403 family nucleotidyltransferase fold protein [Burkholderiales bacterium]|nr:GSU2403 family nucleotidyltransferase fold protein [Burkholderiales bacterium]
MNDFDAFARLIVAIEPWRAHLVFVGGWAQQLYRFHPLAEVPNYQSLSTKDTDLAFSNQAPLEGNIRSALIRAGFSEELSGELKPPVARYTLGEDNAGFYAEFLTPLLGSTTKRNGSPDATVEKAGITAQKLRHLDILLVSPWQVRVGKSQHIPLPNSTDLQIPNPVSFIAQKLLIHENRSPAKRAQDLLYIHDALELFGGAISQLANLWRDEIKPQLADKTARRTSELSKEYFSSVTDTLRNAARIPQDRRLTPERMQAACELALEKILG